MPTKINEAWATKRRAELAAIEQARQAEAAWRAEQQAKHNAFVQQTQGLLEAWERGERTAAARQGVLESLGQAFRASDAARAPYERELRRQIDGTVEHQHLVEDMSSLADVNGKLPARHQQWARQHINAGNEPV